jgi:hypothetical protein
MTMKYIPHLFLLLSIFLVLSSCEEDFDITAPYKDITIAYGLLDLNEDTTYVRINKAFLGDGNVLEMVEVEDSSVYKNGLDAYIEEWSNGNYLTAYQLDSMTIDNKDTGLFYNPYHLLYYGVFDVKPEMEYKLKIQVNGKEVTGNSNVVNDFSLTKPNAGPSAIKFTRGTTTAVEWESAKYGRRYEVLIRFNFKEIKSDLPDTISRSIDWFLGTEKSKYTVGGEEMYSPYQNDAFYSFLSDKVPYLDPSQEALVSQRFTYNVQFIISVGGDELNTYMEVNEPSNSIIQEKPDYTNLTNGLGLFSSRYRKVRDKKISLDTVDEILKLDLKFVY